MNILVYTSQYRLPHEAYGAPFTEQLVRAMRKLADVTVVCPTPWYPRSRLFHFNNKWLALANVPARYLMDGIEVIYPKYPMIPKVSGVVQPMLQVATSIALISKLHRKKKIDVINARWIYPDGVAAVWIGQRLGIPVVLTALGCDINLYSTYRFRGAQIRWALHHADHVTAVSAPLAQKMVELGVPPDGVSCEPNGVDLGRFRVHAEATNMPACGLPASPCLLVVARLSEEKGIGNLIAALHLLKQRGALAFHTVVVGDGPQKESLTEDVNRYSLAKDVLFTGAVPHADVDKWMSRAHALCLPSLREGMPNVVLEALASGLPVVASRVGGIPDVINTANGIMVEPGMPEDLAAALEDVFSRKWDSARIRASVEHLSWDSAASAQIEMFRKVLARVAPRGAG